VHSFDEPKESAPLIALAKLMLPAMLLIRHGTTELNVVGDGLERFKTLAGERTIICPNHSSWDDTDMIFAFSSLVNENFNYLAAWEVLHSHFGYRTWLQHVGCYSIIRGYPDRASFKATRNLLIKGKHKIVIFPEGEISHDSNNLLPIKAGMSQMAFSALRKLEADGLRAPIYILPLALRYKIKGDARPALEEAMAHLEKALGMVVDHTVPLYLRIKKASRALLSKLEREYTKLPDPDLSFDNRIDCLRSQILERVADQLNVVLPKGLLHLDSAHILQSDLYALSYGQGANRQLLHKRQLNKQQLNKEQLRQLAKDLHRVVDFISIYDGFVAPSSSPERLAEVIDLLEAEILQHRSHKGVKTVSFDVGEPINLLDFYPQYKINKHQTEEAVMNLYKTRMLAMFNTPDRGQ
jgi:1-acyl-sn-glycerol-3-phosphate acyltransferase